MFVIAAGLIWEVLKFSSSSSVIVVCEFIGTLQRGAAALDLRDSQLIYLSGTADTLYEPQVNCEVYFLLSSYSVFWRG